MLVVAAAPNLVHQPSQSVRDFEADEFSSQSHSWPPTEPGSRISLFLPHDGTDNSR